VDGAPFAAQDSIYVQASASGLSFVGMSTDILVSDYPASCAKEAADQGVANGRTLFIGLGITDASGSASPATESGTYLVVSPASAPPASSHVAEISYQRNGANCLREQLITGTSGTVQVGQADTSAHGGVQGTLDVTFENGDHLTGNVSAVYCASFNPNRTPLGTCQ